MAAILNFTLLAKLLFVSKNGSKPGIYRFWGSAILMAGFFISTKNGHQPVPRFRHDYYSRGFLFCGKGGECERWCGPFHGRNILKLGIVLS